MLAPGTTGERAAAPSATMGRDQSRVHWLVQPQSSFARWAGIVFALCLALTAMGSDAARWQRDTVIVRDYTSGRRWGPIIARQVEALNAALPANAPRFIYRDAGARPCAEINRERSGLNVCSMERLSRPAEASVTRRGDTIHEALIVVRHGQLRVGPNRVCHELMHAVTAVEDRYGTESASCVRGYLATFGAWDAALLASEYGGDR